MKRANDYGFPSGVQVNVLRGNLAGKRAVVLSPPYWSKILECICFVVVSADDIKGVRYCVRKSDMEIAKTP